MKSAQRERAVRLRIEQQLSYGTIARELGVSKSTLSRWLEDLPLSDKRMLELRRNAWTKGEASRERFRATMRKKRDARDRAIYERQKKSFELISERDLYIAGLMLYVAEGDKKTRAEIAFANTDVVLVYFFAQWITRFLGIPANRLRVQLHLYENMNVSSEETYWRKELHLKKEQFVKTQIRPIRKGNFSYPEPFRHGTAKLYVGGVVPKAELMLSIKAFFDTYSKHMRA